MPVKTLDSSRPAPADTLQEDGITNPKDGRGPLRKSDDSSIKLPPPSPERRPH
jgi:hypothetical protein